MQDDREFDSEQNMGSAHEPETHNNTSIDNIWMLKKLKKRRVKKIVKGNTMNCNKVFLDIVQAFNSIGY